MTLRLRCGDLSAAVRCRVRYKNSSLLLKLSQAIFYNWNEISERTLWDEESSRASETLDNKHFVACKVCCTASLYREIRNFSVWQCSSPFESKGYLFIGTCYTNLFIVQVVVLGFTGPCFCGFCLPLQDRASMFL